MHKTFAIFRRISRVFTASTVRHLYLRGGAGVGSMTKIYGSRQRNGVCPAHYSVGSKNVARKVLQALELLKMIEKDPNGCVHPSIVINQRIFKLVLVKKKKILLLWMCIFVHMHCYNVFWCNAVDIIGIWLYTSPCLAVTQALISLCRNLIEKKI